MRVGIHCGPLAGIIHTYADACGRMLTYAGGHPLWFRLRTRKAGTNSVFPGAGIVLGNCMRFYCLYGNTMNVASRMCSNAKEGGICASRDLVRRLEGLEGTSDRADSASEPQSSVSSVCACTSDRADSASEPQSSVSSVCASREVVRRLEAITDSGSEAPSSVTEPQSSVNANERSICARTEAFSNTGTEALSHTRTEASSVNANERSICASRDLCYLNGIMLTYADVC
jgi:hypothetical protein